MERSTTEVKLTQSGYTAHIYTYLTRGEKKRVTTSRYEGAKIAYINGDTRIEGISQDFMEREDDILLEVGVARMVDEKSADMPKVKETFDKLPDPDTAQLILKLREVMAGKGEISGKKNK